jgi:3-oxoadipate CoA-transferase, alpha subunit
MIDKRVKSLAEAVAGIGDGAVIMVGGFGAVGQPDALLGALAEVGTKNLTIIANNAGNEKTAGIGLLLSRGQVRKVVCSFPKGSEAFSALYDAGKLELEIMPQGTLAERIRAAGAGIPAFFTPAGVGTVVEKGKETRVIDGRTYLLETALKADVALIEGWQGDRWGNISYRGAGGNFNPLMAMAAATTIAQVNHLVDLGDIEPMRVGTPGVYVQRMVEFRR